MTEQEPGRIPVHSMDKIPDFENEDEEVAFWRTHRFSDELLDQASPLPPDAFPPGWDVYARARREQPPLAVVATVRVTCSNGEEKHFILHAHLYRLLHGYLAVGKELPGEGSGTTKQEALLALGNRLGDRLGKSVPSGKFEVLLAAQGIRLLPGPPPEILPGEPRSEDSSPLVPMILALSR